MQEDFWCHGRIPAGIMIAPSEDRFALPGKEKFYGTPLFVEYYDIGLHRYKCKTLGGCPDEVTDLQVWERGWRPIPYLDCQPQEGDNVLVCGPCWTAIDECKVYGEQWEEACNNRVGQRGTIDEFRVHVRYTPDETRVDDSSWHWYQFGSGGCRFPPGSLSPMYANWDQNLPMNQYDRHSPRESSRSFQLQMFRKNPYLEAVSALCRE